MKLSRKARRLSLTAALLTGVSACATESVPVSGDGLADALRGPVLALESALLDHPETPDPVGEAGADVVIGFCAVVGC